METEIQTEKEQVNIIESSDPTDISVSLGKLTVHIGNCNGFYLCIEILLFG
jgi:hypothetical protein